ncbi:PDZ/DHR/GLGF domain protein [Marvinbryantia formatexigens DSM 14469]|uniref:PDZ/DHR/GLGF domain protein n=1 Tax=Marvinbryantia formatexigens DSM 14469 TaxID=478749 RepID=C6LF74_9FIRM|nr:trypsin-like peptidase domain-containing protein [Marvinbryantia formatexigens]EET60813.1 PDZ/DHR/GLGF domain protein [Marvinbryantia formatexigens DSM 14469]UWO26851.1 trypsin-like peptidase domain-containing protein [Marvinbryantia formatexigens DSM 14469]SDG31922.1 serine protease Do [Marvinbryantia formatexigens]
MQKKKFELMTIRQNRMNKKRLGYRLLLTGGIVTGMLGSMYMNHGQTVNAASSQTGTVKEVQLLSKKDSGGTENKGSLDVSDIVKATMPSVVSITTKTVQEVQDYFGMYSFGGSSTLQQEVEGSGSGIIIGQSGEELLMVTNNHVVENADTVTITFADDKSYEAQVKGTDSDSDLAVVSVKLDDISDDTKKQISVATVGDSDEIEVGEQVLAIGNALGYGQSVTTGIVSAKNRTLSKSNSTEDTDDGNVKLIQTDAAINPGNSGGPLLNMDGEVIGINSVKMASSGIEGMGYAIAISDVKDRLTGLMNETTREKVDTKEQGTLGIRGETVSNDAIQMYGIPEGVFVSEVTDGAAAENGGIQKNDIITEFDGKKIKSIRDLKNVLEYYKTGESVDITLKRFGAGEYSEVNVTVTLD